MWFLECMFLYLSLFLPSPDDHICAMRWDEDDLRCNQVFPFHFIWPSLAVSCFGFDLIWFVCLCVCVCCLYFNMVINLSETKIKNQWINVRCVHIVKYLYILKIDMRRAHRCTGVQRESERKMRSRDCAVFKWYRGHIVSARKWQPTIYFGSPAHNNTPYKFISLIDQCAFTAVRCVSPTLFLLLLFLFL